MTDQDYMEEAYRQAVEAKKRGECPVGAVLVKNGRIIAQAGNEELARNDPTAHAEILCLRRGGKNLRSPVLDGCIMYTTLWPCPMCLNAMLQAQVSQVVAGSTSYKWITEVRFNPANLNIVGPVKQDECRRLFREWAIANNRWEILDGEK